MKHICRYLLVLIFFSTQLQAQQDPNLGIIPTPAAININPGNFQINAKTLIITKDKKMGTLLQTYIARQFKLNLKLLAQSTLKQNVIRLESTALKSGTEEAYRIEVANQQVLIQGQHAGLFYGLQSFMQMMNFGSDKQLQIPYCSISDQPRFKYRGTLLDVARHFMPLEWLKSYIDLLARYKINNFHWHLTDDQGWRIEIKKYPLLTAVGSKRNGTIIGRYTGIGNTYEAYGGFYTQEEARDLVKYAAERYINIIPEIELPGHASAAIAAYPQLSAYPDLDTPIALNTVWSGSRKGKHVQQTWGVFKDVFVPSDYTFNFLQDVLEEVMAIFPSPLIHIGGDECPKDFWKSSAFCQELMRKEGLKDEHELQSYFIRRIERFVNSKGRNIIGWDEILEGGLAPKATVMSWRGEAGGIAAAREKHQVIMVPGSAGLYIDYAQSKSADEPVSIGGNSPYERSYAYDPVPAVLTPDEQQYILGVQANLWSEYMTSTKKAEYFAYPRLLVLAEMGWTKKENKNLKNFSEMRLTKHLAQLDKEGLNFWVPTPIGQLDTLRGQHIPLIFKNPVKDAKIYYTVDGSRPSENGRLYKEGATITLTPGKNMLLQSIVIVPSGRRSVVKSTVLIAED